MIETTTQTIDGYVVQLFSHEGRVPHGFDIESANGAYYVEGMLIFDGKELVDFDGDYFLPLQVAKLLRDLGYIVSNDFLK